MHQIARHVESKPAHADESKVFIVVMVGRYDATMITYLISV